MSSLEGADILSGSTQQRAVTLEPILQVSQPASEVQPPIHEVEYLDERVQQSANYQVKWKNWMSDGKKNSFYTKVSALLLSWHPDCDDMAVGDEVKSLENLFKEIYHYNVTSALIDSRKSNLPQTQANKAVASFVYDNDREGALLIVYYAGHGSPAKVRGDLRMSGRRTKSKIDPEKWSHLYWSLVESNLKETLADVLLIFDCCYSGDLGRDSGINSRSFEYLAASRTHYTRSPGEQSFTSALIWALNNLSSGMFTTSRLAKEICSAPGFPEEQNPSLTSRDPDAYNHIVLAPLPSEGTPETTFPPKTDDDEDEDSLESDPQCLSLTFHFNKKQEEKDLWKLADCLNKFKKLDETSLQDVHFGGIWSGPRQSIEQRTHKLREVVSRVLQDPDLRQKILSPTRIPGKPPRSSTKTQNIEQAVSTRLLVGSASKQHTPPNSDPPSDSAEPTEEVESTLLSRESRSKRKLRRNSLATEGGLHLKKQRNR